MDASQLPAFCHVWRFVILSDPEGSRRGAEGSVHYYTEEGCGFFGSGLRPSLRMTRDLHNGREFYRIRRGGAVPGPTSHSGSLGFSAKSS